MSLALFGRWVVHKTKELESDRVLHEWWKMQCGQVMCGTDLVRPLPDLPYRLCKRCFPK